MKLCVYTENMQNAQKVEYLGEFKTKIEIIRRFIRCPDAFDWPNPI